MYKRKSCIGLYICFGSHSNTVHAMALTDGEIDHLINNVNFPFDLKIEQKLIIKSLLKGQDVLAILPTGFGKSACFGLVGQLMDKVGT